MGGPNYDFCETYVDVQDNLFDICSQAGTASIAGTILTETGEGIEQVEVSLSGAANANELTLADGLYHFDVLTESDYTVTPHFDLDHKNGVSTYDIIVIMRHILNTDLLDSPYQYIAADVDNSGSISISDLIELRKLILSVTDAFTNNTSWRFVDASYEFPMASNPWFEEFPEVISVNNLEEGQLLHGDFIGVKIGDVTGDAEASSLHQVEDRTSGLFTVNTEDRLFKEGERHTVIFSSEELAHITGYQWTMQWDIASVELVAMAYRTAKEQHFATHRADEGILTVSYDGKASTDELFGLVFEAKQAIYLSEILQINSRFTKAEAYNNQDDQLDIVLSFNGEQAEGYALYQNKPNPFKGETVIGFELPEAMQAIIKIQDVSGRTLQIIRDEYERGYNEVRISAEKLRSTFTTTGIGAGVFYYTLETAQYTKTKKMIIVE